MNASLESARRAATGPFAVSTQKQQSGKFAEFGRYDDEAEARHVCRLLAWAGGVPRLDGPNGELPLEEPTA